MLDTNLEYPKTGYFFQIANMKTLQIILTCTIFLSSCGYVQNAQNQRYQDQVMASLLSCMNRTPAGQQSKCILLAYNNFSGISNSEPTKAAGLRYLNNMYELVVKLERGQFRNRQDFEIAGNRIYNEYLADFQVAQNRSAAENAATSIRQQQLFMNAYRLLTPNGSGGVTCYPIQGGPSFGPTAGGMTCQ